MKIECDTCGNDTFWIMYDDKVQGYHAECDACGAVCLKLRSA